MHAHVVFIVTAVTVLLVMGHVHVRTDGQVRIVLFVPQGIMGIRVTRA